MAHATFIKESRTKDADAAARPRVSVYAQVTDLARTASSRAKYFSGALRIAAEACGSPYAAFYLRSGPDVLQDDCHSGPTDPTFWKDRVDRLLTECLGEGQTRAALLSAKSAALRVAIAAVPISSPQANVLGSLALVLPLFDDEPRVRVAFLESLCALIAHAVGFVGAAPTGGPTAGAGAPNAALARAAACDTVEALAFSLTNSLRNKLGCEQVALGLVRGAHVRIVSISGLDDVKPASPGVVKMRAAMEECLDADAAVTAQPERGGSADGRAARYRLHHAWRDSIGGACVASIPLHAGDALVAILSLRRRGDESFSAEQLQQIRTQIEPFAPALQLVQRAARSLRRHLSDNIRGLARWLIEPKRHGRKVLCAAVVAGLGWFCFGSMSYELTVPSAVAPAALRHVSAPFGAALASARAIAGDRVRAGDILCVLDARDLELQRAEVIAQRAVAEQEHALALAANKPVEAKLADVNHNHLTARLASLDARIAQATVRSPLDGVVVSGDLRTKVGAVLAPGDALFEIAPLTHWNIELSVPEYAAGGLQPGLSGAFANHARPEDTRELRIVRVRPRAEVRDGHNVYIAEAEANLESDWLRPGMEGVSKVRLGQRPVWWIALHHLVDYLRLNFWL